MDVGTWLRELGLEQYEAAFRENAIDAEMLPRLTTDDLKEMGVVPIGHRRRLLDAIAALQPESALGDVPVSGPPVDPAGRAGASETATERRPLLVMFCDLIGSTALSARLDPEDLREVIRSYQTCVASTIQQFNGFIARYVGDGVLIYFGCRAGRPSPFVSSSQIINGRTRKMPVTASGHRAAGAFHR